jgi:hypothetical protein
MRTWSSATSAVFNTSAAEIVACGAEVRWATHSGIPISSSPNWSVNTALSTVTARKGWSR